MQSEGSQTQRDKHSVISLLRGPEKSQIVGDRKWDCGCQGLEGGESGEFMFSGTELGREGEKVLKMDGGVGHTTM